MNYHLLSLGRRPRRVRVQVWLDDGEPVPSVIEVWPTADWHEREAWDMMGIAVEGHPNLKRILMDGRLGRPPAAQGLPDRRRAGPLLGGRVVSGAESAPEKTRAPIYEGTRIPHPIPTLLRVSDEIRATGDVMPINFGPNHPSTHGVLRLIVDLYGEDVVGLEAVVGYLHTGFEKTMEQKTWWKAITYPERIDYLSFQNNELVFVLAIEQLLGLEIPPKASWMRTLLCELNRIHSHLIWLGTAALELGAISMFWYCFREREQIMDLFEMVTGTRMHTRYFQAGGLAEDIPRGFYDEAGGSPTGCRRRSTSTRRSSTGTRSGSSARRGSGCSRRDDAIALGQSGPVLRGSGVDWDLRKAQPYLSYDECDFRVPVYTEATCTRATACTWRRCASRCGSSSSASTGSRAWRASRGSPTTARSCCRRARSSTPRWSR